MILAKFRNVLFLLFLISGFAFDEILRETFEAALFEFLRGRFLRVIFLVFFLVAMSSLSLWPGAIHLRLTPPFLSKLWTDESVPALRLTPIDELRVRWTAPNRGAQR